MKKYNYENLKEDEHVVPSLGILPIKISEDYNYIPKNIIFNLISDIIIIPIVIILAVIAKIFLGFKNNRMRLWILIYLLSGENRWKYPK